MNINNIKKAAKNPPIVSSNVQQMLESDAGQQIMEQMLRFVELEHLYESAIREVKTKLEILDSEFRTKYSYNPIHHIESRLKSPQSLFEKMQRKGLPINTDTVRSDIFDFAGVRVVCNYIDDIYTVADLLTSQDDVKLITRKDYIENPKPNGYRSLHLVVKIPVFFATHTCYMSAEVQIRTIAQHYWAGLEHQLKYKRQQQRSQAVVDQLLECAEVLDNTEWLMLAIRRDIEEGNAPMATSDFLRERLQQYEL